MSLNDIRALTFDTGGTILDWHTGFSNALAATGAKHGLERKDEIALAVLALEASEVR
jgi:phosphoglycolate phosphatase-like HAD superfamily hydrolase